MEKNGNIFAWLVAHFGKSPDTSRGYVQLDDKEVRLLCPDGHVDRIRWAEILRIRILTTDLGPWIDDLFYMLEGAHTVCVVPGEADDRYLLRDRLLAMPGFVTENFIAAMASTDNAEFECWQKSEATT